MITNPTEDPKVQHLSRFVNCLNNGRIICPPDNRTTFKLYVGFTISDSMFSESAWISKKPLDESTIKYILTKEAHIVCENPSHKATFVALEKKFRIKLEIPEKAPIVRMLSGDEMIVISVRGLPRLEGRLEYTEEEILSSVFSFSIYEVMS